MGIKTRLEDRIILPPTRIVEEDKQGYRVLYGKQEVYIAKANSSGFTLDNPAYDLGTSLHQSLIPIAEITQDSNVPSEFILPMIFHELREKEYVESGVDNPHERALNDEVLFVIKNLNASKREKYFEFAENYRKRVTEELRKKEEAEEQGEIQARLQRKMHDEGPTGDFFLYNGCRWIKDYRRRVFLCTNEETAERINSLTEELKTLGDSGIVRYQGGVLPPEKFVKAFDGFRAMSSYFACPRLITGSRKLNDYLVSRGVNETRLYDPLEDSKPFNKLKEIVDE